MLFCISTNAIYVNHAKSLFHFYTRRGVGLAIAENQYLSVTEDFTGSGGVIGTYILYGGSGYELRLKGEVFGSSQYVRVIRNAIAPTGELVAVVGSSRQGNLRTIVIDACACYQTLLRVAIDGNGMLVNGKFGCIGGIALYRYFARVVGVTVIPLGEM